MNFGAGIGAGFAVGIATSMVAGRRRAGDDLRKYIETNNITIRDGHGESMLIGDFLSQALGAHAGGDNKIQIAIGILLGILALFGFLVFFLMRS
ncbi:MAG: hypothetical protein JSV84_17350 [Gemmatimonadota bacterium]|nr:MAG: hypothetical protein JSV84_17350 [Gemmatimonadota bacterium]